MGPEYFFKSGVWIIPLVMIILCFLLFNKLQINRDFYYVTQVSLQF
jgi:hypothetical protein